MCRTVHAVSGPERAQARRADWNPSDATVYAANGDQFYPLVNVETGELQLERAPITWLDTTVDAGGTLALGIGTGSIGVKFEETPGGLFDLVVGDNGDIWLLNSTIGVADSSDSTGRDGSPLPTTLHT